MLCNHPLQNGHCGLSWAFPFAELVVMGEDFSHGWRGIVKVLIHRLRGSIEAFRVGRFCDARGRANRANDGHLLVSFIHALHLMGAHPVEVAHDFTVSVDPCVSEEVIQGFSEGIANAALCFIVVVVVLPAGLFLEIIRGEEPTEGEKVHVRGEIHVICPVRLGQGPLVSLFTGNGGSGFDFFFLFRADSVRVGYCDRSSHAEEFCFFPGLVIQPSEGSGHIIELRDGAGSG